MKVGMVADVMPAQGVDHIVPSPHFQLARLFADDLECRADVPFGKHVGDPLVGIIVGRQQIILRVKPKNHIHRRRGPGRLALADRAESPSA